ncbi:helix-turn-helix domain-containing protein [Streptomyces sp. NPDC060194]|uniref:helix-turn-helix domain-containing protein n=1 Tax=Streptomyces sp. NPDC060194 TaxID=3347069 RepID=UPI00364C282C
MAVRTAPTERQMRLGAELRRMRTAAGVTAEHAARLLAIDRGRLSNIENGLRPISPERVHTLAEACGCDHAAYVDALAEMAAPGRAGWWEGDRGKLPHGLLDIAELEAHSARLRAAFTIHVPGLLQTPEHALAVFRMVTPALQPADVARRLAHRVARQEILDRPDPPDLVAIVHEAALRMQFGGAAVARAQLEHLVEQSERDNVTLLAIPFTAGGIPGAGLTFVYAEGPVPELDTVQVDTTHGPEFVYAETQLAKYRAHLDLMEELALSSERSRDFIHAISRQI